MGHRSAQNSSRVPRTAGDQPPALTHINSVLDELLPGIETTITFDWNPVRFLEQQYGRVVGPPLEKVITWTEHGGNVEAQECGQYVEQQWPNTGEKILWALDRAVATRFEKETAGEGPPIFRLVEGRLQVTINDLETTTAEMVGLLCWLGAACRASNAPNLRSYCTPALRKMTKTKAQTLEVSYPQRSSNEIEGEYVPRPKSWHLLSHNSCIARGFPVSQRGLHQKGAQMPFILMAGLACTNELNLFDRQLVLKGFSRMFVPIESDNSAWITWHFFEKEDGGEVTWNTAFDQAIWPCRAHVKTLGVEEWRHFVD